MSHKPVVKAGLPVGKPTTGMSVKNKTAGSEAPAAVVTPANNAALAEDRIYRVQKGLNTLKDYATLISDKTLHREIKQAAKKEIKRLKGIC